MSEATSDSDPEATAAPFHAIVEVGTLEQYLETLQSIVAETTLHAAPAGIGAEPVDPASVATVNQRLDARAFGSYEADGVAFGVDLQRLDEYLGKADSDDLAELRLDDETRMLHVRTGASSFAMATIDPDAVRDGQDVDEMGANDGFSADVEAPAAAIDHAVDLADMVGDHLVVDCDPDRDAPLVVRAEGDTDEISVGFEESLEPGSTVDTAIESLFSVEYLSSLVGVIPDDATVRLRAGDEWPLRLDYEWADGAAAVSMVLAPRIQRS